MTTSKNDRNGVRTAQDLERKYDLKGLKRQITEGLSGIKKVDNELMEFIKTTVAEFGEIQTELDGKIETWFYAGIPTLTSEPVISWDDLSIHIGDLYYDTDTGIPYRFKATGGTYSWEEIRDKDTARALAAANAAKDTADSKRRIFTVTPNPPYDRGDLWFNDKEIYICVDAKASGSYTEGDFTIATNYTENINAVAKEISMVKGDYAEFKVLTAGQIEALGLSVESLDADKVNVDMANIDAAWINNLMVKGSIFTDDISAATGSFSYYLTGVNIVGDNIVGHTITADKIIIRDPNSDTGVLYEINNGVVDQTDLTEEKIKRLTLNGEVITAFSITADKINVTDLFSQNITANGEFRLGGAGALYYDPETDSLYLRANSISIGESSVATQKDITDSANETLASIEESYATKEELNTQKSEIEDVKASINLVIPVTNNIKNLFQFTEDGLIIGRTDSVVKSIQTNASYKFTTGSEDLLTMDTSGLEAKSMKVKTQIKMFDKWAIRPGQNNNLNDVWIGG